MTDTAWQKRQERVRAIAEQERAVRIPVAVVDAVIRWERVQWRLAEELGRDPTAEEVAGCLGISTEVVQQLMAIVGSSK